MTWASLTTGRTTWKPDVFTVQRILARPDMSSALFFWLNVIANGPSHSPDHAVNGVVSLPTVPDVRSLCAASPYQCTTTFGSATLPWMMGTWPVCPAGCTHSTLMTADATDAHAAPAPPAARGACCAEISALERHAITSGNQTRLNSSHI